MKIIFYLPVNTDKPKFVAFFVFVCIAASFIAQISSFREIASFGPGRKTVNSQGYSELLHGANQNARKLLFTDLVNTEKG